MKHKKDGSALFWPHHKTLGHTVEAEQRLAIFGDEKKYQTKSGLEGAL